MADTTTSLDTIKGMGDATAADIAEGKTAVVQGQLITGTAGSGNRIVMLGTGTSFDVSSYAGYENFTTANFIVELSSKSVSATASGMVASYATNSRPTGTGSLNFSKSYNASTGAFSVSASVSVKAQIKYSELIDNVNKSNASTSGSASIPCTVYLMLPE